MEKFKRARPRSIFGMVSLFGAVFFWLGFIGCATTRKLEMIQPQPVPPLDVKVYESPGVDWSACKYYKLELREKGRTDTLSNQILERYLLRQIEDCLHRKGYVVDESSDQINVRVFFGISEKERSVSELRYGFAGGLVSCLWMTQYPLEQGIWYAAQTAAAAWLQRKETTARHYEASISVEIFDRKGENQFWRGDVALQLVNNDIRLGSNLMIRELLWHLPTLDYPAICVPEVSESEFSRLWNNYISEREFYSPGQVYPIRFEYAYFQTPLTLKILSTGQTPNRDALSQAETAFKKTAEYKSWRQKKNRIFAPIDDAEETYGARFLRFVFEDWNPSQAQFYLRHMYRFGAAMADLVMTAPIAIHANDGSIMLAGRYYIGEDSEPTIIAAKAEPLNEAVTFVKELEFVYQQHYITAFEIMSDDSYQRFWVEGSASRAKTFGRQIDRVSPEPSQPWRI